MDNSLSIVKNKFTIVLKGEIGTGKTTFSRGFIKSFGYKDNVKSPTFPIIETYDFKNLRIHHYDFYRLKSLDEIFELGFYENFKSNDINIIEWPNLFEKAISKIDLSITFEYLGECRLAKMISKTLNGQKCIEKI